MGIQDLWKVFGEGEVWHIADYASDFFRKNNRPLRIAVDEAGWRFKNVVHDKVLDIRAAEPAANPVEKVILQRIYRLLRLNVQLIFVDDGLSKPHKKRKKVGGGKPEPEVKALTRKLLTQLKVPHHQAPGEAEAECARMQVLGIVDAVWSDDGDTFMFGCGTLIKQHRHGQKVVTDYVQIHQAEEIKRKHDLDSESLVLFALLAGGDYLPEGLRGCGFKTAALVAQRRYGLGSAVCHAERRDLVGWRGQLDDALKPYGKAGVPLHFPDFQALEGYRNPNVSTDEQLHNLRGLRKGWEVRIDQRSLRVFLREHFNFTTREFLKHIAPFLVARRLAQVNPAHRDENIELGIQLRRTRKKKVKEGEEEPPVKSEVKCAFSPFAVLEIDISSCPPEEDWSKFAAKDGTPYDPTSKPVECELLDCLLKHGLPEGTLVEPPPPARGRKRKNEPQADMDSSPQNGKKQRTEQADDQDASTKKRGSPKKKGPDDPAAPKSTSRKRKSQKDPTHQAKAERSPTPPPATFRMPEGLAELRTAVGVVDLCDEDDSSSDDDDEHEEDADLARAIQLSLQDSQPSRGFYHEPLPGPRPDVFGAELSNADHGPTVSATSKRPSRLSTAHTSGIPAMTGENSTIDSPQPTRPVAASASLTPGEAISAQTLRELRMSSSLLNAGGPQKAPITTSGPGGSEAPVARKIPEVIDLT